MATFIFEDALESLVSSLHEHIAEAMLFHPSAATLGDQHYLYLCEWYCSCGNPDPLHEECAGDCHMWLPLGAIIQAELVCQGHS